MALCWQPGERVAAPPNQLMQATALPPLRSGKSTPERGRWALWD